MAATAGVATPIYVYEVASTQGAQAAVRRLAEKSGQNTPSSTYLYQGTPVQVDVAGGTGFIIACPAITSVATAHIAGISLEPGHNLTTSGVPQQVGTAPSPPQNQPNAVIIFGGAWPSDGTLGFAVAQDDNLFVGIEGGSTTDADGTIAQAQLGAIYGLTQDATTKYWYVDIDKNGTSSGACVEIVGFIDPVGTLHGRVMFRVTKAAQQLLT